MKKLLTLLICSTLMFACGSGDDDPVTGGAGSNGGGNTTGKTITTQLGKTSTPIAASEWKGYANDPQSPNYIGKDKKYISPIFGDWILTHENGTATNRFVAYRFTIGQGWYSILTKPAVGENPNFKDMIRYQYNDTQIKDGNDIIYTYKTSADLSTMTLYDGSNTWAFKKYDNNGVWIWKGDWNDPKTSPYYAVYNGQYNPVKGKWRLIEIEEPVFTYDEYWFKEDFSIYVKDNNQKEYKFLTKYKINDISINTTWSSFVVLGHLTNKYWIEGDTLYLQGVNTSDKLEGISKLVRVK